MTNLIRIGIDVGGTNTDAVAMSGRSVLQSVKRPTSADVTTGICAALSALIEDTHLPVDDIGAVMIGTTHFVNAVVQRKDLTRVAVIRLCGPATRSLPPMVDWPADLREIVRASVAYLSGGAEFDGRELTPFDEVAFRQTCANIREQGWRSIAITSVFAPVSAAHEQRAAAIVAEELPHTFVSLSHEIGRIGFHERENATILNACLRELGQRTIGAFRSALATLGLRCPLYLTQNDGTLMSADYAERFPVFTFASGPTNSMRGAAFLSGLQDAIVIDIGGTTTDVGALMHGFPREASVEVEVGGVRTNFRMPDVFSFGLGGGSYVLPDSEGEPKRVGVVVGPRSVGYELTHKAQIFGGDVLTATDIAVASGALQLGDRSRVAHLPQAFVHAALQAMHNRVEEAIDRVKLSREPLPVILVGGGSVLIQKPLAGSSQVVQPPHFQAANAVGAAIAQISGEVDRVFSLEGRSRDAAVSEAKQSAIDRAVEAGADPSSMRIVDVEDVPLAYLPGSATRIRVKAVGEVKL